MSPRLIKTQGEVEDYFSGPAIASTAGFLWNGLHVDCRWEPPAEIPEVSTPWHVATLFTHLPEPPLAERRLDGRFKVERVYPGDVLVVPAFVGHSSRWDAPGDFINLVFEPTLLARTVDEAADEQTFVLQPHFATQDLLILQIGLTLKRLLLSDGPVDRLYAETMASALAVHLLQRYAIRKPILKTYDDGLSQAKLQTVIDYIYAHLEADLSLERLSGLVEMSPHYFCKLFKQSTGLAPHQYVIRCRVEQAKALLTKTRQPIAEVAYAVGFANQSHLNRHFKRLVGMTPGQFREG